MSSVEVRSFAENGDLHAADAAPVERLDADMSHVLNVLQAMGGKRIEECRAPEARALPTLDMALRRILRDQVDDMGIGMEMRLISGPTDEIRARIYVPQNDIVTGLRPMILFLHGGGFVLGDVDHYDATPRALAARTGAVVVSAHYRRRMRTPTRHGPGCLSTPSHWAAMPGASPSSAKARAATSPSTWRSGRGRKRRGRPSIWAS